MAIDTDDLVFDPDWSNAVCRRIVGIEDSDGRSMAHDVALDDSFLRHGGPHDELLCALAPKSIEALRIIAAIPLWGQALPDGDLKSEFTGTGQ